MREEQNLKIGLFTAPVYFLGPIVGHIYFGLWYTDFIDEKNGPFYTEDEAKDL